MRACAGRGPARKRPYKAEDPGSIPGAPTQTRRLEALSWPAKSIARIARATICHNAVLALLLRCLAPSRGGVHAQTNTSLLMLRQVGQCLKVTLGPRAGPRRARGGASRHCAAGRRKAARPIQSPWDLVGTVMLK